MAKPGRRSAAVETAIDQAKFILEKIDERWPEAW
jgi:hypothetical protein